MPRRRTRLATVIVAMIALIAPASVVALSAAPATADGNGKHRHDLDTYKREGWVAVGDTAPHNTAHEHLYCDAGDYAVDGMWKVDAHDGDDRGLRVDASYGDDVDVTEWHFRFTNTTPGRAQVKMFVTCLDYRTGERDGHSHVLGISTRHDQPNNLVAGPNEVLQVPGCVEGEEVPVAPGFNFTSGSGTPTMSWHFDLFSWQWRFEAPAAATVNTYLRCLDIETSSAAGHTHAVDKNWTPNSFGQTWHLPAGISDQSLNARPHDEGIVGTYYVADPAHVAFLGQDARGQVRDARFVNDGLGDDTAMTGLLGIDKRTTKYPS